MVFAELLSVIAPPKEPVDAHGDWGELVEQLGLSLPVDYMQFVDSFGSGSLNDFISSMCLILSQQTEISIFFTNWHRHLGRYANLRKIIRPWRLTGYFSSLEAFSHGALRTMGTFSVGSRKVKLVAGRRFCGPVTMTRPRNSRCR
jgi:hypothetical protein